jgi:ribonuclease HII
VTRCQARTSVGRATAGTVDLYVHERQAQARGYRAIAGVDEVGRGPLAGPVVAAAVILPAAGVDLPLADSKTLSADRREALAARLRAHPGVRIGLAEVGVARIDEINILQATIEAMVMALRSLQPPVDLALVDGLPMRGFPLPAEFIVKGDACSASIAAASIVAKVARDALMVRLDAEYPGYGLARHKGYGTREHVAALARLGPTAIHRRTFAPVAQCGKARPAQLELPFGA